MDVREVRCLAARSGTDIALGPLSSERILRRSNMVNSSLDLRCFLGGGIMGARTMEVGMPSWSDGRDGEAAAAATVLAMAVEAAAATAVERGAVPLAAAAVVG